VVASDGGEPTIVGGGRYVVVQPGQAEVAFAIIDSYQGLGIGSALMRHLATLGREAGLREFIAEVLSENLPMLNVFERSGLVMSTVPEAPCARSVEAAWRGESPVDDGRPSERTARTAAAHRTASSPESRLATGPA
jgi:RimJ/RimL family protein N-acetyltransferase